MCGKASKWIWRARNNADEKNTAFGGLTMFQSVTVEETYGQWYTTHQLGIHDVYGLVYWGQAMNLEFYN